MNGPDYRRYRLCLRDVFEVILRSGPVIVIGSILCYNDIRFSVLLLPYIPICMAWVIRRRKKETADMLDRGFGDFLKALSAALEAGFSVENAVREARRDLLLSHGEKEPIMKELAHMEVALLNNVRLEELFLSLAERSGIEDIRSFSTVFTTVNRTGGNLVSVIAGTTGVIRTRIALRRELQTAVAGRQLELRIMKLMPPVILIYLRFFMGDTVGALYGDVFGALFMTVMLAVYAAASGIAEHMADIEL